MGLTLKFNNKNTEKCIKTIGLKLCPIVSEKWKLRKVVSMVFKPGPFKESQKGDVQDF